MSRERPQQNLARCKTILQNRGSSGGRKVRPCRDVLDEDVVSKLLGNDNNIPQR